MTDDKSASVPEEAKQAEEVQRIAAWAELSVWSKRMLIALVTGVKGGRWFSLIDKVHSQLNLESAYERVRRNKGAPGVDGQSTHAFERHLYANLKGLREALKNGTYRPKPVKRVQIPKPGSKETRPLGIPTVRDRVVQTAVRNVLEPIFEREFAEHSYGFRPKRGCKDALKRVEGLLKTGYTWVVDADLKSYFDTIDHEHLMELVERRISDSRVLDLLRMFLEQEIMEDLKHWVPEEGTPQGAVISPLLSNIYLDPLDHHMAERGYAMVRYADDFVILCQNEEEAKRALEEVAAWTTTAKLTLHPTKTRIVNAQADSFAFLGYEFRPKYRFPRKKSLQKLRDTIRGHTPRKNGESMKVIIQNLNPTLRGWFEYFKHSHRTIFRDIDGWVRMRLRSILRKRHRKKGRGRGSDHQRWPNSYFAALGYFSLEHAHQAAISALRKANH
jgi:RNA-directed DNA polymerase